MGDSRGSFYNRNTPTLDRRSGWSNVSLATICHSVRDRRPRVLDNRSHLGDMGRYRLLAVLRQLYYYRLKTDLHQPIYEFRS